MSLQELRLLKSGLTMMQMRGKMLLRKMKLMILLRKWWIAAMQKHIVKRKVKVVVNLVKCRTVRKLQENLNLKCLRVDWKVSRLWLHTQNLNNVIQS